MYDTGISSLSYSLVPSNQRASRHERFVQSQEIPFGISTQCQTSTVKRSALGGNHLRFAHINCVEFWLNNNNNVGRERLCTSELFASNGILLYQLDTWLSTAAALKVEGFDLRFDFSRLPRSIFSCRTTLLGPEIKRRFQF